VLKENERKIDDTFKTLHFSRFDAQVLGDCFSWSWLFERSISQFRAHSESECAKTFLKFWLEITLTKVSFVAERLAPSNNVFDGVLGLKPLENPFGSLFRVPPEIHECWGMEGWSPAIRVWGSVPPAGLLKTSAADGSPHVGKLYIALA
jgi:hypothetical protein